MSHATKLMKLRRRKDSTHWCPMPRYRRWEFTLGGYDTASLAEDDPDYVAMTSTDGLTVTYTLRYEDED